MDDLTRRVRDSATTTNHSQAVLSPRAAAKAEREERGRASRQHKADTQEAVRAETARRTQLAHIINTFRASARHADDVGTIGFSRLKTFKKHRLRLGRRPRGWVVGAGSVPLQFPDGVRQLEAQLILCADGRLYASLDGVIGARYQVGQTTAPTTPWMLSAQVWRLVEDTIPETVGALVGYLGLTWPAEREAQAQAQAGAAEAIGAAQAGAAGAIGAAQAGAAEAVGQAQAADLG
ncbi:MAG: hypothetical protein GXP35_07525 [Actinobacteria bacterium]|nr:hypothetical protein [Actinomycetota bacterium]